MSAEVEAWLQNEPLFRRQWEAGNRTVVVVARRLEELGVRVRVTEPRFRSHVSERGEFTPNDVDLWADDIPIEVKGRGLMFSGLDDFPMYPIFVDTVRGWDAKRRRPVAVVEASSSEPPGFLVVPSSSEPRWLKLERTDRVREIREVFYAANREDCRAIEEFASWLVEQQRPQATRFCDPPMCPRKDLVRIKVGPHPLFSDAKPGETVAFRCRRCGLVYSPREVVGGL